MLVDPAFLTLIKDPPGRKKSGSRSKVVRKSSAGNNPEKQEKAIFKNRAKQGRKKKNREFDRYL